MKKSIALSNLKDKTGAVAIMVALLLIVFIGFAALAIDLGHLYVVRNELQNAADAGALAGARFLYNDYGTSVNPDANQIAYDAATANNSEKASVDVLGNDGEDWTSGNDGDVQRGHWSFATLTFEDNVSLDPVELWNASTAELDADPKFINAIKVVTRRQTLPAASFFAGIFGYENFELAADAVAYIGFAGTLGPGEADQPIAICEESLLIDDEYSCNFGRMLNSGSVSADHNTAGWTNFSQPCSTASAASMKDLLEDCNGNPDTITLGANIGTSGGVEDAIINHPVQPSLMACWKIGLYDTDGDGEGDASIDRDGNGWPDMPWNLTLPVIACPGNNVAPCSEVRGAVNVNVVWILEKENDIDNDAPYEMGSWDMTDETSGQVRWDSFVTFFKLLTVDNVPATVANDGFKKKSIYFLPDCTPHELTGVSGGENFGVLAKIPVLVE
jgi:Flp pilus assembly protein TadG